MSIVTRSDQRARRRIAHVSAFGLQLGSPFLLDRMKAMSTVTGAWSNMRLTAAWVGPCLRLRRTDGEVADIYFDNNGRLSMTSMARAISGQGPAIPLSGFHLGKPCYLALHFDQSGRGQHLVPPSNAAQPIVLDAHGFITNDGSPPLVAFDGVDDLIELPIVRTHPFTLAWAGSTPDRASAGQPFIIDGRIAGRPTLSGAALLSAARLMYAGIGLGDRADERGRHRTFVARFASRRSQLVVGSTLVSTGDAGEEPTMSMLLGLSAGGAFSNTSYHTIINLAGAGIDPVALGTAMSTAPFL